jgi:hypothetical protein
LKVKKLVPQQQNFAQVQAAICLEQIAKAISWQSLFYDLSAILSFPVFLLNLISIFAFAF